MKCCGKELNRQENKNAIFTPFSPTTLEYFLYFEKAAIKLVLPTNILPPLRDILSDRLANRIHWHSEPHAQAPRTGPHWL